MSRHRNKLFVIIALLAQPLCGTSATLPSSAESYVSQAARVRQSADRPWAPEAGQLGNLRHLQITAPDCVIRIVSGTENRVFPGSRGVIVVERSRVLDADPNEQPAPRDVVLAIDRVHACPGLGSCGVSITSATSAPSIGGAVCFTVQLATAHDLLLGGDDLSVLVDRVRQPALRIKVNPSYRMQMWLEQVDIGLLSIDVNAAAHIGGNGQIDFLQAGSSSGGSTMFLQDFHAHNIGVSTTTTGTHWAIRIDADTKAVYYQPARAPGAIAENYGIEVDGPINRLDVPVGRVDPYPLREVTRIATRVLRDDVIAHAGPAPQLPPSDPALPSAKVAAAALPIDSRERVAQVVARYLPPSIRITNIALWKQGGRLEGIAPDAAMAHDVVRLLTNSGEFTYVSGGGSIPRDGGHAFSTQLSFACDAPGQLSTCPAGHPMSPDRYSYVQISDAINVMLGPTVTVRDLRRTDDAFELKAVAPNEAEARAALQRLGQRTDFLRVSISGYGPSRSGAATDINATLKLICAVPPKPDGICTAQSAPP
ncbi:hypothetical protein ELE36_11120 [Pseudolysobacter antarcticus]|uniref:Uncharacterized protein n=1 Tax=Pseudolysobacter antarcticus TaxID=2511995 RepID=A0A411HK55_9GAMM|nr:hypothetical protein [Pseudolysobacter antarcticus]QBB70861.1 hypothetical protein ELE36_11120 [Pseudolysobacter antarcticus]